MRFRKIEERLLVNEAEFTDWDEYNERLQDYWEHYGYWDEPRVCVINNVPHLNCIFIGAIDKLGKSPHLE